MSTHAVHSCARTSRLDAPLSPANTASTTTTVSAMADFLGLPYQLLVDSVLSYLDSESLRNLRQVSRSSQRLVDDDLVWRRKIAADFNFPVTSSARMSGWQLIYKGLCNPELYTWGDYTYDRIGQKLRENSLPSPIWNIIARLRCVPFPLRIKWREAQTYRNGDESTPVLSVPKRSSGQVEGAGVPIQIHAGGWSFYALTGHGQVLAWGRCADEASTSSQDTFQEPTMLDLYGKRARSLTVGREHAVVQTDDGTLIEWCKRWDRPGFLDVAGINAGAPSARIVQIEAGWDFTAVLMVAGDIEGPSQSTSIVFWKTKWTELRQAKHFQTVFETEREPGTEEVMEDKAGMFPLAVDAVTLPALPDQVIKIAAGDDFVIALTKTYSVYFLSLPALGRNFESGLQMALVAVENGGITHEGVQRVLNQATSFYDRSTRNGRMEWKKLSMFCDDLYASGAREGQANVWDEDHLAHLVTKQTRVTHISAQFRNFAVYAPDAGSEAQNKGKGIVILGSSDHTDTAKVMPELQGIQVIKVSHGDWHSGALTLDGRLLTWGEQANGALGSWDSLPVPDNAMSTLRTKLEDRRPSGGPTYGQGANRLTGIFSSLQFRRPREPDVASTSVEEAKEMVEAEKERYRLRSLPQTVESPLPVRFGFARAGRGQGETDERAETKYVFDIAFAGWHSGALAIDRSTLLGEAVAGNVG